MKDIVTEKVHKVIVPQVEIQEYNLPKQHRVWFI